MVTAQLSAGHHDEAEKAHLAQQKAKKKLMHEHRAFLFDADGDGDRRVTFEEFVKALPMHLRLRRSLAELHSWFNLIDSDGNGRISVNEFFKWSLSASAIVTGSGIVNSFQRYDNDASGHLDEKEFELMAEECGYGEVAHELYRMLPHVNGKLDYRALINSHMELLKRLDDHSSEAGVMKDFLVAMSWNHVRDSLSAKELRQDGWALCASDADSLRTELRKMMRWHTLKLSELFAVLDTDKSGAVSLAEFERALIGTLGFDGDAEILRSAFARADANADGEVTLRELDTWLRGHGIIGDDGMSLESIEEDLALRPTADDESWSADRLRSELCEHVVALDLTIDDLVEAWDKEQSGEGTLTRREFLRHMKRLVLKGVGTTTRDPQAANNDMALGETLWYAKVRVAAGEIFDEYDGDHDHVLETDAIARALLSTKHQMQASRKNKKNAAATATAAAVDAAAKMKRRSLSKKLGRAPAPAVDEYAGLLWTPKARAQLEALAADLDKGMSRSAKTVARLSKPRQTHLLQPVRHRVSILAPADLPQPSLPPLAPSSRMLLSTFSRRGLNASLSEPMLRRIRAPVPHEEPLRSIIAAPQAQTGAPSRSRPARLIPLNT